MIRPAPRSAPAWAEQVALLTPSRRASPLVVCPSFSSVGRSSIAKRVRPSTPVSASSVPPVPSGGPLELPDVLAQSGSGDEGGQRGADAVLGDGQRMARELRPMQVLHEVPHRTHHGLERRLLGAKQRLPCTGIAPLQLADPWWCGRCVPGADQVRVRGPGRCAGRPLPRDRCESAGSRGSLDGADVDAEAGAVVDGGGAVAGVHPRLGRIRSRRPPPLRVSPPPAILRTDRCQPQGALVKGFPKMT